MSEKFDQFQNVVSLLNYKQFRGESSNKGNKTSVAENLVSHLEEELIETDLDKIAAQNKLKQDKLKKDRLDANKKIIAGMPRKSPGPGPNNK